MPIYVHHTKHLQQKNKSKLPFGIISHGDLDFKKKTFEVNDGENKTADLLELKLLIPQQEIMQYFIQWQRYRKYWWSSITTTPSLFAVGDIKQADNESEADIVAKLAYGIETVEKIKIKNIADGFKDIASLTCSMSLERALYILLLDGLSTDPQDQYLRLHRKLAPYKMSFAFNYKDPKNKQNLIDLSTLLFHRVKLEKVSACLPDFSIESNEQIARNLQMGIPYTAVLDETTLQNGIIHLMNSSTMLKEQVHITDFHTYAGLICNVK